MMSARARCSAGVIGTHDAAAAPATARLARQIAKVTSFLFSIYKVVRRRRIRRHIVVAAVLVLALPPGAAAHGDPAGEVLLEQDVFLPVGANIGTHIRNELVSTVQDANRAGFAVKVAVINTRYDLGIEFDLYGKPQPYAADLGRELAGRFHGHLLVVMPSGFGSTLDGRRDARRRRLLRRLPPPGNSLNHQVAAATRAVRRMASASGYDLAAAGGTSETRDRITIAAFATVLLALTAGLALFRRGRS